MGRGHIANRPRGETQHTSMDRTSEGSAYIEYRTIELIDRTSITLIAFTTLTSRNIFNLRNKIAV